MQQNQIKKRIGEKAATFVENDMIVGLGTGSTAACFIESLAERLKNEHLHITCVATSEQSEKLALSLGIQTSPLDSVSSIDITFDGADEIDPQKRLIKGAGGALLREKILAYASSELIIMADESKQVEMLGTCKLPVEVVPYGHKFTKAHLLTLGYKSDLRKNRDGTPYITDNHNYILDIHFHKVRTHPEEDEKLIKTIPGVVETGFFFNLASSLLIGKSDGTIVEIS